MKDEIRIFAVAVALLGTAACNTIEGAGKDIEEAGEETSETAREVQEHLSD